MEKTPAWFQPNRTATLITDLSKGFCTKAKDHPLYVPGAERVVPIAQKIVRGVDPIALAHIALADTHVEEEYYQSIEFLQYKFAGHQFFGTEQWKYCLNFNGLKAPVWWIFKNVFDIGGKFGDSGVDRDAVLAQLTDPVKRRVFENLFNAGQGDINHPETLTFGDHRDVFFRKLIAKGLRVVLHTGVAADYCVRDALKYTLGWPDIEYVVLFTDATVGIYDPTKPGGVASLEELIEKDAVLKEAFLADRLVLIKSDEYLRLLD